MPEYLAPGVFVEETSFRQKSIEGVSTSTTGFVGPTRFGPVDGEPPLITSFSEFERIYGGLDRLSFEGGPGLTHNYLAHAVRGYFDEGGKRLYVARVFRPGNDDGVAADESSQDVHFRARYPGRAGNFSARLVFRMGENILTARSGSASSSANILAGARSFDVVAASRSGSPAEDVDLYWVERFFDQALGRESHRLRQDDPDADPVNSFGLNEFTDVRILTVNLIVRHNGRFSDDQVWEELTFSARHADESLATLLAPEPVRRSTELYVPLVLLQADGSEVGENPVDIAKPLLQQTRMSGSQSILDSLRDELTSSPPQASSDADRTLLVDLTGGNDGQSPGPGDYEGREGADDNRKSGLKAFEDLEDISIIAAPGSTAREIANLAGADGDAVRLELIQHCELMRYRVAVLDAQNGQTLGEVQKTRSALDSTRAAFYYPWLKVFDPITEDQILLPPSGFVCGIYARNDVERGVHKTPANEVVRSALDFELLINKAQQETLNPNGINCLRFFEGRGFRVWGGRTISSDPEWKYLNVRRYMAFLERSIEKGTQWAVFENNGPVLWDNVRRTIEDFLFSEWKENHLLGTKPEQAYFVRCDRTTISQNDLDNGRLICLIGVAVLKPAEFVIFRIGQKTLES